MFAFPFRVLLNETHINISLCGKMQAESVLQSRFVVLLLGPDLCRIIINGFKVELGCWLPRNRLLGMLRPIISCPPFF